VAARALPGCGADLDGFWRRSRSPPGAVRRGHALPRSEAAAAVRRLCRAPGKIVASSRLARNLVSVFMERSYRIVNSA
jgi:hypothetical protein